MLKRVLEVGAKKTIQKLSHLGPRHEVPNETAFVDYYIYIYIYIYMLRRGRVRGERCAAASDGARADVRAGGEGLPGARHGVVLTRDYARGPEAI